MKELEEEILAITSALPLEKTSQWWVYIDYHANNIYNSAIFFNVCPHEYIVFIYIPMFIDGKGVNNYTI